MNMRFYWLRDRTLQKQFFIYWEPGKHNLADLPTKHHTGSHHHRVRPIYIYDKKTSPVSIQGCIKLLKKPPKVQNQTQSQNTIPVPEIANLCQLSQSLSRSFTNKPIGPNRHSLITTVSRITRSILQKQKQLSRGDNLLSSLY